MSYFSVHSRDPEKEQIPDTIVVIEGIKAINDIDTFQALLKYCELPPEATLIANEHDVMAIMAAPAHVTGCRIVVDGDIPMLVAHGVDCTVSTGILESIGGIQGLVGGDIDEDITITFDTCQSVDSGTIEVVEIPDRTTDDTPEDRPSETGL